MHTARKAIRKNAEKNKTALRPYIRRAVFWGNQCIQITLADIEYTAKCVL